MSIPGAGRLFICGSLRSDAPRNQAVAQDAYALLTAGLEGKATISGRLCAPAWYPGLVAGDGVVKGEVWRIEDPGLLAQLDACEGDLYVRETFHVTAEDDRRVTAWTYRYAADIGGVPLIASGDYLDWVRKT